MSVMQCIYLTEGFFNSSERISIHLIVGMIETERNYVCFSECICCLNVPVVVLHSTKNDLCSTLKTHQCDCSKFESDLEAEYYAISSVKGWNLETLLGFPSGQIKKRSRGTFYG